MATLRARLEEIEEDQRVILCLLHQVLAIVEQLQAVIGLPDTSPAWAILYGKPETHDS